MWQRYCRLFVLLLLQVLSSTGLASANNNHQPPAPPVVVVVAGAGPAGLFFAQRYLDLHPNHVVHIYESKKDSSKDDKESYDSAFGFGIGERARHSLRQASSDNRHHRHGKEDDASLLLRNVEQITAKTIPSGGLWMVNRADLCRVLQDYLKKTHGSSVRIIHGARVCALYQTNDNNDSISSRQQLVAEVQIQNSINNNKGSRVASVASSTANVPTTCMKNVTYSLFVAADGSNSNIRKFLVQHKDKQLNLRQERFERPVFWKALQLPHQPSNRLKAGSFLPFPMTDEKDEFGAVIPRHPNRFVALLFWRRNSPRCRRWSNPFGATSPSELKESLQSTFPNVTVMPTDDELQHFLSKTPGKEYYMKLNRHSVPQLNAALLGDASNGVYSRLAQGCAFALWQADLLAQQLYDEHQQSTHKDDDIIDDDNGRCKQHALEAFSKESVRQGHSLADLNLLAHLEYTPWIAPLNLYSFASLAKLINNKDLTYNEILRLYTWQVLLAKLIWRFSRIEVQE